MGGGFGAAVYSVLSLINHTCTPNCVVSFDVKQRGSTARLTTIKPIAQGEQFTIAYVSPSLAVRERDDLLLSYGFVCSCAKCISERGTKTGA